MDLELGVAPARVLPDVPSREPIVLPVHLELDAGRPDHLVDEPEEAPRLGRELVERPAEDLVGEAVGHLDVIERRLDVAEPLPSMHHGLDGPLVLVQ